MSDRLDAAAVARHAEMLANRLRKNERRLGRALRREGVDAYRVFDQDVPELRVVVDRYADHAVVAEYARRQTDVPEYLPALAAAAAAGLSLPLEHVHLRKRRTRPAAGPRYQRLARGGAEVVVSEGALRFLVRLDDYLDTGLFTDHRLTRRLVASWVAERQGALGRPPRVLNLFAYTGAFSVAAARAGAATVSVDRSRAYLDWAQQNLTLNGVSEGAEHALVEADVLDYLLDAPSDERFDLVVLDPPSFSTVLGSGELDVQRDHPRLIDLALRRVAPGGRLLFSTNHQRFEPGFPVAAGAAPGTAEELTDRTVPPDHRNRRVHRTFSFLG